MIKIQQTENSIESVDKSVITKLYNAHLNGNISQEENENHQKIGLIGTIQAPAGYGIHVSTLNNAYPKFHASVLSEYMYFADPVIESYYVNRYGGGEGITATQALSITEVPQNIFNNTTVTSFDELVQFGVTSLPRLCFSGATNLTSINTNKITNFGDGCLMNSGITSIDLSSCSYMLGESAFSGCTDLQSVVWPQQPFNIYKNVFYRCTSLQSVDFTYLVNSASGGNYAIRQSCFGGCTNLTSVIIGASVKNIEGWAFDGCRSLSSINLSGIETIGSSFGNCSSLTSVDLSSCTSIGDDAFSGCTSLQTVKLGSNLSTIGSDAFKNCSALTTIQVPSAKLSNYQGMFPDLASKMVAY